MTRIPEHDRDMIEQAIYLPMVLTVLNRDLLLLEKGDFKLKRPYKELIEQAMKAVQTELAEVKRYLRKENIKVSQTKRDDTFTMFLFLYKGYEEYHNYFNPRIRNKVEELMHYYLYKRLSETQKISIQKKPDQIGHSTLS
ncbi:hypothetical protein [Peribacillus tepidiphilus]|uniref:hypothetical protein n=1 Tax=Peribacillus tepidiphilus TaxID=2652445 RepID=UPI0012920E55|nr:hypothetical protein [Peribacillus tepidiphilus]